MKKYELLRHKEKLPHKWVLHNPVRAHSKFYSPLKSNNGAKMNPLVFVFLLSLPLFLSGCMGIYEGGFECPAGVGVGCKSISDVNQMVDRGEIPKVSAEQPTSEKLEIWYAPSWENNLQPHPKRAGCPCLIEAKGLKRSKERDDLQSL